MHGAVTAQLNRPEFTTARGVHVTDHLVTGTEEGPITPKDVRKGCEVKIVYKVENRTLASLNSLGLVNPLSLAWELLPMSFVVDWFIPIGGFLRQLTAPLGLEFTYGYETKFAYGDFDVRVTSVPAGWTGWSKDAEIRGFGMERKVLTSWPRPSMVVNLGLNQNQLLTAAGLIAQRLR